MAQPKGYAAFILFPHLKMIPLFEVCSFPQSSSKRPIPKLIRESIVMRCRSNDDLRQATSTWRFCQQEGNAALVVLANIKC